MPTFTFRERALSRVSYPVSSSHRVLRRPISISYMSLLIATLHVMKSDLINASMHFFYEH
jgi:hypothetical protein